MNAALLARFAWKILYVNDNLLVRMLQAKYVKGSTFWDILPRPSDSMTWKGILSAWKTVWRGACFMREGEIPIWTVPWAPWADDSVPRAAFNHQSFQHISSVADLFCLDSK